MHPAPIASPSRRHFLRTVGTGLVAAALGNVTPLRARGRADFAGPRSLVLIQLAGGNDGFNTVVPLQSDDYHRLRPTLALTARHTFKISERYALHRALAPLQRSFDDGHLAIVPHVGYPLTSDSHFCSTEIWHTASTAELPPASGWAGRSLAALARQGLEVRGGYGGSPFAPKILQSDAGADQPLARLTTRDFGSQLREIADLAARDGATEIYFVTLPGFDTHFEQAARHAAQLTLFGTTLGDFQTRLAQRGVAGRVLTVVFSEFGRALAENHQGGTDHGPSSPVLLLGANARGGVHLERDGESTDFRRLVATLTHDWLGLPILAPVVEPHFAPLPMLQTQPAFSLFS